MSPDSQTTDEYDGRENVRLTQYGFGDHHGTPAMPFLGSPHMSSPYTPQMSSPFTPPMASPSMT